MPSRPTELDRRPCGCLAEIDRKGLIFVPCTDETHRERLGLFWRVVAKAKGMPYCIQVAEDESAMHLPCGCRWALKEGTLHVFPCLEPGHEDQLLAAARVFCRVENKELRELEGRTQ